MRTPYKNLNGESGIEAYEIHEDNAAIDIEFASGGVYTYYKANISAINFNVICQLAIAGAGLNAYLNGLRKQKFNGRLNGYAVPTEINMVNVNADQVLAVVSELKTNFDISITMRS